MNNVNIYVQQLRKLSNRLPTNSNLPNVAQPSTSDKMSEYYRLRYVEEQLEQEFFYSAGGGDGGNNAAPISTTPDPSFNSYPFWQINEFAEGASISNLSVIYNPFVDGVQINWGDASAQENINSGVDYNHTFVL